MLVNDAKVIVNSLYEEMTGKANITEDDTTSIVDIGKNLQGIASVDVIYRGIADRIGKMIIRNKAYVGKFVNILRDGWEYGNILQTLRVKGIEAKTDPSYNPVDGTNYPLTTFEKMDVVQKFYNTFDNFQLEYWRPTDQLWSAFNSYDELTRFFTGVENAIQTAMNVRLQGLAKTAINNMIAQTMYRSYSDTSQAYGDSSTLKAVNLLKLYNDAHADAPLTAATCRDSEAFLRFAAKTMNNVYDRLTDINSLYNIDGEDEFTAKEDINITLLSTFANDIKYNLYNAKNQFDYSLMELPGYDVVPYWQGCGTDYSEDTIGTIKLKIKIDDSTTTSVDLSGIVGIMFDKDAVAINCERKKVTTFYHPDLDQTKFFDKYLGQYINAFDKQFVVFFIADAA